MKIPTALALLPMALGAVEVELDFAVNPATSSATATYRIGPMPTLPPQSTETYTTIINYLGNLLVTAEVDSSTGEFESFEFTGGNIGSLPNITANLTPKVGSVDYTVIFSTNGIRRVPDSSSVDPMTSGVPNGTLHFTEFTEGSMTVTNYISVAPTYDPVSVTRSVAEDPTYLILPDLLFPVSLGTFPTASDALSQTFFASLRSLITLPVQFPSVGIRAAGLIQYFTHEYSESGEINATVTFAIPTDYGQWAIDNGLTLTTGEEVNAAGMPYALLFAFDLPADAAGLPLILSSTPVPTVALTLPAGGLGFTVEVEYAADPAGPFTPLPDANFLSGTDSLDAGRTAPATLSYPVGPQGYLRFFVTL